MVTKRLTVFWLECLNITIFVIVFGFLLFYVIGSTLTKYDTTDHYLTSLANIPGVNMIFHPFVTTCHTVST